MDEVDNSSTTITMSDQVKNIREIGGGAVEQIKII